VTLPFRDEARLGKFLPGNAQALFFDLLTLPCLEAYFPYGNKGVELLILMGVRLQRCSSGDWGVRASRCRP
jgi:hypothetical protein